MRVVRITDTLYQVRPEGGTTLDELKEYCRAMFGRDWIANGRTSVIFKHSDTQFYVAVFGPMLIAKVKDWM